MDRRVNDDGFTLLESLIALGILMVGNIIFLLAYGVISPLTAFGY